MKIFKDRKAAGKLLVKHLKQYLGRESTVVLGIPRGGVVVAVEIAKKLKLPLDIIVTRKIGAPNQEELALGAVDPDGNVVWEKQLLNDLRLKVNDLKEEVEQQLDEIKRRESIYLVGKKPLDVEGKTVILVDDGIATGSTTLSAINYLKRHQVNKIILAVPVASKETVEKIIRELGELGEIVVLETPVNFAAVGQFYYQFNPVTDSEVVQLLNNGR